MRKKESNLHFILTLGIAIGFCFSVNAGNASLGQSSPVDEAILDSLEWRCIGPANPWTGGLSSNP